MIDSVCASVGLDTLVSKLPKGYYTQVDKWIGEDGFEPSGGENQRIAIAAWACYHGGDVLFLGCQWMPFQSGFGYYLDQRSVNTLYTNQYRYPVIWAMLDDFYVYYALLMI